MESNRAVVSLEPRKIEHGSVLMRITTSSCGSDQHMVRRRWVALIMGLTLQWLCVGYGVLPAWAQTEKATEEINRPALQIGSALRFNEDWSTLKGVDLSRTDDFWDHVKFIPLTQDQSVWLSFGGQARARVEYFNQFQWGASQPEQSDAYLLSRLRLSADLHVTPYFRMYVEGKSALVPVNRKLQGDNSTAFYDQNSLFNGFADIMIPFGEQANVTLRGGRQELLFGSQRLVGPGDYTEVPHTFDGVQTIGRIAGWTVTPFWTQAVIVGKYNINTSTTDHLLWGIYGTAPPHLLPMNLDLYYLGADNTPAAFNGTSGQENRHTLGLRTWGKIGQTNWDFELEGAGQFGTVGSGNISAGMFTAVLGYTLPVKDLSPRAYLEFDYASGDPKRGGNVGTFNQLFPNGHAYLGYIDYIGRQNIISSNGGISVTPLRDLTLTLQQYFFWRASIADSIYNKSSAILRAANGTTARYVGAETDLFANYNFTRHLQGYTGYSYFFPGGFIHKTGPHKASNFYYAQLQYTF
jgi:Alginate export